MDNEPRRRPPRRSLISTGATSIVLIFVMLSLLTFAVLSLVSAQADLRLSRKSADRTTAYYEAENAANDILAGLLRAAGEGPEALAREAERLDVTMTEDGHAAYQVPLGEDQVLSVEVTIADGGTAWETDRWQAVSRYDWNADAPLDLLSTGALPVIDDTED